MGKPYRPVPDERGAWVPLAAVILITIFVASTSIYYTTVVPGLQRRAEFIHSSSVRERMLEFQDWMLAATAYETFALSAPAFQETRTGAMSVPSDIEVVADEGPSLRIESFSSRAALLQGAPPSDNGLHENVWIEDNGEIHLDNQWWGNPWYTNTHRIPGGKLTSYNFTVAFRFRATKTENIENAWFYAYLYATEYPSLKVTFTDGSYLYLYASADAYVDNDDYQNEINTNFGDEDSLKVYYSSRYDYIRRSYLKFDLSRLPPGKSISSAQLALSCSAAYDSSTGQYPTIDVHAVTDDSWQEDTITWNNAPAFDPTALDSVLVSSSYRTYYWDVTTFIQNEYAGDQVASLLLKLQDETTGWGAYFRSREYLAATVYIAEDSNGVPGAAVGNTVLVRFVDDEITTNWTDFGWVRADNLNAQVYKDNIYYLVVTPNAAYNYPNVYTYYSVAHSGPRNPLWVDGTPSQQERGVLWYGRETSEVNVHWVELGYSYPFTDVEPVFVLRFSDDTYFGNPYHPGFKFYSEDYFYWDIEAYGDGNLYISFLYSDDEYSAGRVYSEGWYDEDFVWGENFSVSSPLTVTAVEIPVSKYGDPSYPLEIVLENSSWQRVLTLKPSQVGAGQKPNWYRLELDPPVTLSPGNYLLYLRERSYTKYDYYVVPLDNASGPFPVNLSWQGETSHAFRAVMSYSADNVFSGSPADVRVSPYYHVDLPFRLILPGYRSPGMYTSPVISPGRRVRWLSLDWDEEVPPGTSLRVEARLGFMPRIYDPNVSDYSPAYSWSEWREVRRNQDLAEVFGTSYMENSETRQANAIASAIQFRVFMSTSDPSVTPRIWNIAVRYYDGVGIWRPPLPRYLVHTTKGDFDQGTFENVETVGGSIQLNRLMGGWETDIAQPPYGPGDKNGHRLGAMNGKIYFWLAYGGENGTTITAPNQYAFYSYDPASDTWTQLADAPFYSAYGIGSCVAVDPNGENAFYIIKGYWSGQGTWFARYTESGGWVTLNSNIPWSGSAVKTYPRNGATLVWDGGDRIYLFPGSGYNDHQRDFYYYSISNDTWTYAGEIGVNGTTDLLDVSQGPGNAAVFIPGSAIGEPDNYLYVMVGRYHYGDAYHGSFNTEDRGAAFFRYNLTTETWELLTICGPDSDHPYGADDGSQLAWDGGDRIYHVPGSFEEYDDSRNNTSSNTEPDYHGFLMYYSLSAGQWFEADKVPWDPLGGMDDGGGMVYLDGYLYVLKGGNDITSDGTNVGGGGAFSTVFWRYSPPIYYEHGRYTSPVIDMGERVTFTRVEIDKVEPAGNRIDVYLRFSNDASTWTDWMPVSDGTALDNYYRYVQYRLVFDASTDNTQGPIFREIRLTYIVGQPTPTYYWTQTDWSGGGGQLAWSDASCYYWAENLTGAISIGDLILVPGNENGEIGNHFRVESILGSDNLNSGAAKLSLRFRAQKDTSIHGIRVYVENFRYADLAAALYSDNGGVPGNALTSENTVPIGSPGWVYIGFDTPVALDADRTYHIVLRMVSWTEEQHWWVQTSWGGGPQSPLQVGQWDQTYDNFFENENVDWSPGSIIRAENYLQTTGYGPGDNIVITEVCADPTGATDDNNEFVELYNRSDHTIDINGWIFGDGDVTDTIVPYDESLYGPITDPDAITGTTLIPSGAYVVIVDQEYSQTNAYDFPPNTYIVTVDDTTLGDGLAESDIPYIFINNGVENISTWTNCTITSQGDGNSVQMIDYAAGDTPGNWGEPGGVTPGARNSNYAGGELTTVTKYENGWFTSSVFDTGNENARWNYIDWSATVPSGTEIRVYVRFDNSDPSTWSTGRPAAGSGTPAWQLVSNGDSLDVRARYAQYGVEFVLADDSATPELENIRLRYGIPLGGAVSGSWSETDWSAGPGSGFSASENIDWENTAGSLELVEVAVGTENFGSIMRIDSVYPTIRSENADNRISIRFTAPESKTVTAVWIYVDGYQGSPSLKVDLENDDGTGRPSGTVLTSGSATVSAIGWMRVVLDSPVTLSAGRVYHLVIYDPPQAFYYAENEPEASTTSTVFENHVTLTFTPSSAENYLILASAVMAHDDAYADDRVEVRLLGDGVVLGEGWHTPDIGATGLPTDNRSFATHAILELDATQHTFVLQYRTGSGDTAFIENARILAVPVSNFWENASESRSYTDLTTWQTKVSLTTPSLTRDNYLLIATAEFTNDYDAGTDETGDTFIRVTWNGSDLSLGYALGAYDLIEPNVWNTFATFELLELEGSHTFTIDYHAQGLGDNAYIENARITLIRVGDLGGTPAYADNESGGQVTASLPNYDNIVQLSFTGGDNYLLLGTAIGSTVTSADIVTMRLLLNDEVLAKVDGSIDDADDSNVVFFALEVRDLPSGTHTLTIQAAAVGTVYIENARVLAIPLTTAPTAPPAPSLVSPENDNYTNDNTPVFQWSDVSGETFYRLVIDNDPNFADGDNEYDNANIPADVTSIEIENQLADGVYYWRVAAVNEQGETWSETRKITVDTVAPVVVQVLPPPGATEVPVDNAVVVWFSETVVSASLTQTGGKLDPGGWVGPTWNSDNTQATWTHEPWLPGDTITLEVSNYVDRAGNSGQVYTWSFTTLPVPTAPVLVAPENDTHTNDNTPTFEWIDSSYESSYRLVIDNDPNFADGENTYDNAGIPENTISVTIENELPEGVWYWRVAAINSSGENWSENVWMFTVDITPPTAQISVSDTLITDADVGGTFTVTVTFSETMDASVDPTITFSPDVTADTLTFSSGSWSSDNLTYQASYSVSDAGVENVGIDVTVSGARDLAGNLQQDNTGVDMFSVDTRNPDAPVPIEPENGAYENDNTPTFRWTQPESFENYTLVIDDAPDFASPVLTVTDITDNAYTPSTALADGTYYWRVRAYDQAGNPSQWSDNFKLVIDTQPPSVSSTTPADGGTGVAVDQDVVIVFSESLDTSVAPDLADNLGTTYTGPTWGTQTYENDKAIWSHPDWPGGENIELIIDNFRDLAGNWNVEPVVWSFVTAAGATATATGPVGYDNQASVVITYSVSGTPDNVELWYTTDGGNSWFVIDNDADMDGSYAWTAPAEGVYGWYARAIGGGSTESIPTSGTPPEAENWVYDSTPPLAFDLLSPGDGENENTSDITLQWQNNGDALAGIDNFIIYINGVENRVITDNTATSAVVTFSEGTYSWYVVAVDRAGNRTRSASTFSLTVDLTAPSAPILVSPPDGYVDNDPVQTLDWDPSTDAGTGVDNYILYINGAENQTLENTQTQVTLTFAEGTYTWYVVAVDYAGNRSASASRTLTIDLTPPDAPAPIEPENGAYENDNTPTFRWTQPESFENYTLVIDDAPDFASPVLTVTDITDNAYTPSTALADGTYYWRVRAYDQAGNPSQWSDNFKLVIDTQPPSVSSTTPADGETGVAVDQSVIVIFTEPMSSASLRQIGGTDPGGWVGPTWNSDNTQATWTHNDWVGGETITLELYNLKDRAGNQADTYTWSFTTALTAGSWTQTNWDQGATGTLPYVVDVIAGEASDNYALGENENVQVSGEISIAVVLSSGSETDNVEAIDNENGSITGSVSDLSLDDGTYLSVDAGAVGEINIADNIVISEIYINAADEYDSEFVELYNPTDENINIGDWYWDDGSGWVRFGAGDVVNNTIIPAHGYLLLADGGWSTSRDNASWPEADIEDELSLGNTSDNFRIAGPDLVVVDAVSWGGATGGEGDSLSAPAEGASYERKARASSTAASMRNGDSALGNAYDTDNNAADFVYHDNVNTKPEPENSASPKETPPVSYSIDVRFDSTQITTDETQLDNLRVLINFYSSAVATYTWQIWNWDTAQWETLNTGSVGTSEVTWENTLENPGAYIENTTDNVRLRLYTSGEGSAHTAYLDYIVFQANYTAERYRPGAYIESSVLDLGTNHQWDNAVWSASTPAGTSITVWVRSSDTDNNPYDGSENWSSWRQIENAVNFSDENRYLQYRVELSTTDASVTPVLYDITFYFSVVEATATATGPVGYENTVPVTLTYTWTGAPENVKLYYTTDGGTTWQLAGADTSVDGSFVWYPPENDNYGFTAVAIGGGSTEADPPTGAPEVGYLIIDTVPPRLLSVTPENGATNVSVTENIIVVFDNSMDTSVTPRLTDNIGTTYTFVGWSKTNVENDTATWTHPEWQGGQSIEVTISKYRDLAGNWGPDNSWSFSLATPAPYIRLRALSPLEYLWPEDTAYDDNLNLLSTTDGGATWVVENKQPVFILEYSDGTYAGNPYVAAREPKIFKDNFVGENMWVSKTKRVEGVAFYVRKSGSPPELRFTLVDENGTVLVDNVQLAPASAVGSSYGWVENSEISFTLVAGRRYVWYLSTPGGNPDTDYYQLAMLTTEETGAPWENLTYDGADSFAVVSGDGGQTWVAFPNSDASFRFTENLTRYSPAGFLLSNWYDSNSTDTEWNTITFSYSAPSGTTVKVYVQVDNSGTGEWVASAGPFTAGDGSESIGMVGRYIRYRVELSTADNTVTPRFDEIEIQWSKPSGELGWIIFRVSSPVNENLPYDGRTTGDFNVLYYTGSDWLVRNQQPIFVLYADTDSDNSADAYLGNPYDENGIYEIYGSRYAGVSFTVQGELLDNTRLLRGFSAYLRKIGSPPALHYTLYDVTEDRVVDNRQIQATVGSAWSWISITAENLLLDGHQYRLYLWTTGGDSANHYQWLVSGTSLSLTGATDRATFDGANTFGISSTTSGNQWIDNTARDPVFVLLLAENFRTSGVLESSVFDAGEAVKWESIFVSGVYGNSTVRKYVRTGEDPDPYDGGWSDWQEVTGTVIETLARYIQYRLELQSASPATTPVVREVKLMYQPVAGGAVTPSPSLMLRTWRQTTTEEFASGRLPHEYGSNIELVAPGDITLKAKNYWGNQFVGESGYSPRTKIDGLGKLFSIRFQPKQQENAVRVRLLVQLTQEGEVISPGDSPGRWDDDNWIRIRLCPDDGTGKPDLDNVLATAVGYADKDWPSEWYMPYPRVGQYRGNVQSTPQEDIFIGMEFDTIVTLYPDKVYHLVIDANPAAPPFISEENYFIPLAIRPRHDNWINNQSINQERGVLYSPDNGATWWTSEDPASPLYDREPHYVLDVSTDDNWLTIEDYDGNPYYKSADEIFQHNNAGESFRVDKSYGSFEGAGFRAGAIEFFCQRTGDPGEFWVGLKNGATTLQRFYVERPIDVSDYGWEWLRFTFPNPIDLWENEQYIAYVMSPGSDFRNYVSVNTMKTAWEDTTGWTETGYGGSASNYVNSSSETGWELKPHRDIPFRFVTRFASAGSFVSKVFDAGHLVSWEFLEWDETRPPGTSVEFYVRVGNNPGAMSEWFGPYTGGRADLSSLPDTRLIQYRVDLRANSDASAAPAVHEVRIAYYGGLGSITIDPHYREYPDQEWVLEGGALILVQDDKSVMISPPAGMIQVENAGGNNLKVTVTYVFVSQPSGSEGRIVARRGGVSVSLLEPPSFSIRPANPETPNKDSVTVSIRTEHASAWHQYFERLSREINSSFGSRISWADNSELENGVAKLVIDGAGSGNDILYYELVRELVIRPIG